MLELTLNDGLIKAVEATLSRDLLRLLMEDHVTHDRDLRANPVSYKSVRVSDAGVTIDLTVNTAKGEAHGFINLTHENLADLMAAVDHLIELRGKLNAA